ncbi:unnamed protein product [Cochlearia groenlandica]
MERGQKKFGSYGSKQDSTPEGERSKKYEAGTKTMNDSLVKLQNENQILTKERHEAVADAKLIKTYLDDRKREKQAS